MYSKEVPIEDLQTRRKMQYIRRKDASNKRTGKFISGTAGGEASAGRIKYYSESGKRVIADYELPYLADVLDVTIYYLLGMEEIQRADNYIS